MDARRALEHVRALDAYIDSLNDQLEVLRQSMLGIGASRFDDVRVQTSPTNGQEKRILAFIEKSDEINKKIDEYVDEKCQILDVLCRLSNADEHKVLYLRYFEGKTFAEIAEEMCYSERQVFRIYNQAIEDFQQLWQ